MQKNSLLKYLIKKRSLLPLKKEFEWNEDQSHWLEGIREIWQLKEFESDFTVFSCEWISEN